MDRRSFFSESGGARGRLTLKTIALPRINWTLRLAIALLACPLLAGAQGSVVSANSLSSPVFERDVRPIFKARCFSCHGEGEELKNNLDLRLRRTIATGGKSGPALIAGDPQKSLLYQKLFKGEMPKGKGKIAPAELETIREWIAAGAPTLRPEPAALKDGYEITPEERAFWSFQPIRRPAIPSIRHLEAVRTPIDALILHRLEENNLCFAPEADKLTLIRRATFDLTGLPPTPQEVEAFVADVSTNAYEKIIDRLLASPRYGEQWGRHWLDVAGYADSDGYVDTDPVRQYAYKYRDYVIEAFNDDKPFDQFIREQIAGDEMVEPPYTELKPDQIEKLVATGFLRMAPDGTGAVPTADQAVARNAVIADTIKIVSSSLLGLTIGCAQCHNHKYDPIPQVDYYRLRAIFEPAYDCEHWRTPAARLITLYTVRDRAQAARIEVKAKELDAERQRKQDELYLALFKQERFKVREELREAVRTAHLILPAKRTAEQTLLLQDYPSITVPIGSLVLYEPKWAEELQGYVQRVADERARKPREEFVQAMTEVPGVVPATHVFARGDPGQPKQVVTPGVPSLLDEADSTLIPVKAPTLATTGRRLAFAQWLTSGKNPLVTRVLVNRIWMHHFGRGIVNTPADFGVLGDRPTNPELLDWLADEFMSGGWRVKTLQKQIMMSAAYRQSSRRDAAAATIDPDDRLLWRMPVRRLEGESLRDSILAVSGDLNTKMYGPPVPVAFDETGQAIIGIEVKENANRSKPLPVAKGEDTRRSIYVQVRRSRPLELLETFDEPTMSPNCDVRTVSTVAPQSLTLMNGPFIIEQSMSFARRVAAEAGIDPRERVIRAWRLAFGQTPGSNQIESSMEFLSMQEQQFQNDQPAPATAPTGAAMVDAKAIPAKPLLKPKIDPQMEALASFCQALLSSNAFLYVD